MTQNGRLVIARLGARPGKQFPVDVRTKMFKAGPRRVWKYRNRPLPVTRQLLAHEILNLRSLLVIE